MVNPSFRSDLKLAMFQHPAGELQRLHQRRWRRWSVAAGAGAPADAGAAGAWRMV